MRGQMKQKDGRDQENRMDRWKHANVDRENGKNDKNEKRGENKNGD